MMAIIPMAKMIFGKALLTSFRMFQPINAAEIPKNNRLNPTIIETRPVENIGNNMNIKPSMIEPYPPILFASIISPPFNLNMLKILFMYDGGVIPQLIKD